MSDDGRSDGGGESGGSVPPDAEAPERGKPPPADQVDPRCSFLSYRDLSRRWNVCQMTIRREVERGYLVPTRIAGTVRFAVEEVERYEGVLREEPGDP